MKITNQSWLAMKLTAVLLMMALLKVQAGSFSQQVSFTGKQVSLEKVFAVLKKQTGYSFFYADQEIAKAKPVTLDLQNVPLTQALDRILKDQPLQYTIEQKTIFIKAKTVAPAISLPPATDPAKGKVTSENGEVLPGVNISIKGGKVVAITNERGEFSIADIPSGSILVFSGVNTENLELALKGQNLMDIRVKLKNKTAVLQEVSIMVNTGYQTLSRERSAGSYAKPEMDIVKDRSTGMNILQRLDGLVPGLTVNNAPSAVSNPLLIRGLTTIGVASSSYSGTNRNPLYVIDGIPMDDLSSVNPQDVADITVLKDATAGSIWGARASNGVIVISTRKGVARDKIQVQYDGFVNFQGKPNLSYIPTMNSQQFIQTARQLFDPTVNLWGSISAYTNIASTGVPPHEVILYNQSRGIISAAQANASLDSLSSLDNVSQIRDLWYRNAMLTNHTVSLSGGNNTYSFYGSAAYTGTQSNRPGDKNNSYKINLRQDIRINPVLQVYVISDLTNTKTSSLRNIAVDNRFLPYQLFKDNQGNNLSMPYVGYLSDSTRLAYEARSRVSLDYNPLDEVNYGVTKSDALLTRLTGGLTLKLFKGLRFEGVYGYIKGSNRTTSYDDAKSYPVRAEVVQFTVAATPSATPVYALPTTGGKYSVTNVSQQNWTVRNQLVYDNAWKGRHQLVVLLGQEAQDQLTLSNASTVRGYNQLLQTYSPLDYASLASSGVVNPVMANNSGRSLLQIRDFFNQGETESRFTSYYSNAAYTYNRKYTVNASWRIDQSNLFGLDKSAQNRPVWSAGAKWMISEEKFMKNVKWLDRLAVRATYGITGNSPLPGTTASFDILSSVSSSFLPNNTGLQILTPGNRDLTWESTRSVNLGFDFAVLRNRLSGSVDLYSKKTEDLIGDMAVNSFTGYNSIIGNFGSMNNKGVELSIRSLNVEGRKFSWTTIFTMGYNKNKVTQLNSVAPITTGLQKVNSAYYTGYPAFAVFGYAFAGLDAMGDPQIYLNDKTVTKAPNVSMANDVGYLGTYQPVWSGGLSNTLRYKEFTVSINAVYNLGNVMRKDVDPFYGVSNSFAGRPGSKVLTFAGNMNPAFLDRWQKPGDELITNIPSYIANLSTATSRRNIDYYRRSDLNILDASFIKLRDITFSYNLPQALIRRAKMENATLRLQFSNIMLWKANHEGIDPEFHDAFYGVRSVPVNQNTMTVGLHITF